MTIYTVEARAAVHLEEIYDYTLTRWGERKAQEYLLGLAATFERIADGPVRGRLISISDGAEAFVYRYQRHYVYWRIRRDLKIGIVAILHERMDREARLADELP